MLPLPDAIIPLICGFAPLLSGRVWKCAQALLAGAILLPGKRTVAPALCITGLSSDGLCRISDAVLWIRAWPKPTLRRCASLTSQFAVRPPGLRTPRATHSRGAGAARSVPAGRYGRTFNLLCRGAADVRVSKTVVGLSPWAQ